MKKISNPQDICRHPYHLPPKYLLDMIISPGTWEYTCQICGKKTVTTVLPKGEKGG